MYVFCVHEQLFWVCIFVLYVCGIGYFWLFCVLTLKFGVQKCRFPLGVVKVPVNL